MRYFKELTNRYLVTKVHESEAFLNHFTINYKRQNQSFIFRIKTAKKIYCRSRKKHQLNQISF